MGKNILNVPRIKQLPLHCGIASLTMVLKYHGYEVSQKGLAKYFKINKRGIHWKDIAQVSRELGFNVEEYHNMRFEDIINFIDKNSPIISRGKMHIPPKYRHFRVIKGYDTDSEKVYVNDPAYPRKNIFSWKEFNKLWKIYGGNSTKNYGVIIN